MYSLFERLGLLDVGEPSYAKLAEGNDFALWVNDTCLPQVARLQNALLPTSFLLLTTF